MIFTSGRVYPRSSANCRNRSLGRVVTWFEPEIIGKSRKLSLLCAATWQDTGVKGGAKTPRNSSLIILIRAVHSAVYAARCIPDTRAETRRPLKDEQENA